MKDRNKKSIKFLLKSFNIDVTKYDETFFNKTIDKRIKEIKCASIDEYIEFLKQNNEEGKFLLDSLQISYTEFFRNPLTYSVLEHIEIPDLLLKKKNSKRKKIRIWSADCTTGKEAYSIAMLLKKPNNKDGINYRILDTDQCESKIEEIRKGIFSFTALNNLNVNRINKLFDKTVDSYNLKPELKKNIDFSTFDLFSKQFNSHSTSISGDFDLLVCVNLLFYYTPEFRKIIFEKTTNLLVKGGYLIPDEPEKEILINYYYHEVYPQTALKHGFNGYITKLINESTFFLNHQ